MNVTGDIDFTPSSNLLPFGGFEVAALLAKLEAANKDSHEVSEHSIGHQPMTGEVSSGWLRSKLMGTPTIAL